MNKRKMLKIGVIGFGYWGPNLVRNFNFNDFCYVKTIVDLNEERLSNAKKIYPHVLVSRSADDIFKDPEIDAVVIALPVCYHFDYAKKALLNDKHVLIEKPMTNSKIKALELIELAQRKRKLLMVDHTFLYTGAVQKIKELITKGEIGKIQYFDSTRINLGLFQHDVSVIWDLAPHDLSMVEYLVDDRASGVAVTGISHTVNNIENIAYMTLYFNSNIIAHFHVSWISPVKIRQILIGGTKKMIVFNDCELTEKVKVYDAGFKVSSSYKETKSMLVDYRIGDIYIPKIDTREALGTMVDDFVDAIVKEKEPLANYLRGLYVVEILEAAEQSIKNQGKIIKL